MGKVRGAIHERPELNVALARRLRGRGFALPRGAAARAAVRDRRRPQARADPDHRHRAQRRSTCSTAASAAARAAAEPLAELALDRVQLLAPAASAGLQRRSTLRRARGRAAERHARRAGRARAQLQRDFGWSRPRDSKFSARPRRCATATRAARRSARSCAARTPQTAWASAARKVIGGSSVAACASTIRPRAATMTRRRCTSCASRCGARAPRCALFAAASRCASASSSRASCAGSAAARRGARPRRAARGARRAARSASGASAVPCARSTQHLRGSARAPARELRGACSPRRATFALLLALERLRLSAGRARPLGGTRAPALAGPAASELERAIASGRQARPQARGAQAPAGLRGAPRAAHPRQARALPARVHGRAHRQAGRRAGQAAGRLQDLLGAHQDAVVAAQHDRRLPRNSRARGRASAAASTRAAGVIAREQRRAERARARFRAAVRRGPYDGAHAPRELRERARAPARSGDRGARSRGESDR